MLGKLKNFKGFRKEKIGMLGERDDWYSFIVFILIDEEKVCLYFLTNLLYFYCLNRFGKSFDY
jgi:hypothetical protein